MQMFIDSEKRIINRDQEYVAPDGTQYPSTYPKEEIPGLVRVIETQPPVGEDIVITGFYVDGSNTQVWTWRDKTEEEIKADLVLRLRDKIAALEASITPRRLRDALSPDETVSSLAKTWISLVENEISSVRATLTPLLG